MQMDSLLSFRQKIKKKHTHTHTFGPSMIYISVKGKKEIRVDGIERSYLLISHSRIHTLNNRGIELCAGNVCVSGQLI